MGGFRPFADTSANSKVAPEAAVLLCLNADRAETLHTVMDACCTRNPSAFDMGRDEWWNDRLRAAATNDS